MFLDAIRYLHSVLYGNGLAHKVVYLDGDGGGGDILNVTKHDFMRQVGHLHGMWTSLECAVNSCAAAGSSGVHSEGYTHEVGVGTARTRLCTTLDGDLLFQQALMQEWALEASAPAAARLPPARPG